MSGSKSTPYRFSIIVNSKVIIFDRFVMAAAVLLTKAGTEIRHFFLRTFRTQYLGCFGATETISDHFKDVSE